MSKKIVVKMRNIKKILGNEMLQLAIMLSLMRADPEFLLFPGGGSGNNALMDNYDAGDAFPGKEGVDEIRDLIRSRTHANMKDSDSSHDLQFK